MQTRITEEINRANRRLLDAVKANDPNGIEVAIIEGADINAKDDAGVGHIRPLHWAVKNGNIEMVRTLLDLGADPNAVDANSWTPLQTAAYINAPANICELLVHDTDLENEDVNGHTARDLARLYHSNAHSYFNTVNRKLLDAVKANDLDGIETAIMEGADIDVKDNGWFHFRPLHWAVERGNIETARTLLDLGADPNEVDVNRWTPFQLAAKMNATVDMCELLVPHTDLENEDVNGHTASDLARIYHPNAPSYFNTVNQRLLEAAKTGNVEKISELLENGADVNTIDHCHYHFTPLHWAAGRAHTEAVELLLSSGANPNARGTVYGYTALDTANTNPNAAGVKQALASHSVNLNRNLLDAAKIGNVEKISELLEAGADVNTIDHCHYHFTPLHWAAGHAHTEAVELLLSSGANPNAKDNQKRTVLDIANTNPHSAGVKQALVAGGANKHKHHHRRHGLRKLFHHSKKTVEKVVKPVVKTTKAVIKIAEKADKITWRITRPLTEPAAKAITRVTKLLTKPIAKTKSLEKTIARFNKTFRRINSILTPVAILTGGGTIQQALITFGREQVINRITIPLQNAGNRIFNPFSALAIDAMKPIAPLAQAISNITTTINSTQRIVNNLTTSTTPIIQQAPSKSAEQQMPEKTDAQETPEKPIAQQAPIKTDTQKTPIKSATQQIPSKKVVQQASEKAVMQRGRAKSAPHLDSSLSAVKKTNNLVSKITKEVIKSSNLISAMKNIATKVIAVQSSVIDSTVCVAHNLSNGEDIKSTVMNCGGEQIKQAVKSTAETTIANITTNTIARTIGTEILTGAATKVIGGAVGGVVGEMIFSSPLNPPEKEFSIQPMNKAISSEQEPPIEGPQKNELKH